MKKTTNPLQQYKIQSRGNNNNNGFGHPRRYYDDANNKITRKYRRR